MTRVTDELSAQDLYVNVVSRFGLWRKRFHDAEPRTTPAVQRVDEHPMLRDLWTRRFLES